MDSPLILAPMATLSHRAFRELLAVFGGCDLYYTEMIAAGALSGGGRFEAYYTDPLPDPSRLVYQIVGGDADLIVKGASLLNGRAAGIDINMGCSAPEIVRSGGGVAWMSVPEAAWRLLTRLRSVVSGRLSVKLRLGEADDPERLVHFCEGLEAAGVDAIALHPRTSGQKLKSRARWKRVSDLGRGLSIPVIGNGDVETAEDAIARAAALPGGVMVGRGAVRSPWLFQAARYIKAGKLYPYETIDLLELGVKFLELLGRYQPPEFWETRARRFFYYFCDNFLWGHHLKTRLARERELSGMAATLRAHCAEYPEERTPRKYRETPSS